MALKISVRWFGEQVKKFVLNEAQRGVEALAYDVRERARRNLEQGDHIDTKFLYNSVYVATPKGTSPIPPNGTYTSLKGNGQVRRESGEIIRVSKGAAVGAAAEYAVYVEMRDPFLWPAIEETAGASDKVLAGLYAK